MLQLVGGIEEDALFRLCDTIVDHDTAGALVQIEELAEQGQDIGRLVTELIEHLRQLLLVQHVGHVPDSLPVTEETRERLREQANQLPEPTVLRLIDLLAIAVDDMRQGGDPRLPLELALVKITRPQADLSRDSLAHRLEVLESRPHGGPVAPLALPLPRPPSRASPRRSRPRRPHRSSRTRRSPAAAPASAPSAAPPLRRPRQPPPCRRSSSTSSATPGSGMWSTPSESARSRSRRSSPRPGRSRSRGDVVTIEFAQAAGFHRAQIEDPKNLAMLRDALYAVTGRRLTVETVVGAPPEPTEPEDARELSEEDVISLLKDTFDAEEVEEH